MENLGKRRKVLEGVQLVSESFGRHPKGRQHGQAEQMNREER